MAVIVMIVVAGGPADPRAVREEAVAGAGPEPAAPMVDRSAAGGTMTVVRAPTDAVVETAARRGAATGTGTTADRAVTVARETAVTSAVPDATTGDRAEIVRAGLATTDVRSSATTAVPAATTAVRTVVTATAVGAVGATTAAPVAMTAVPRAVRTAVPRAVRTAAAPVVRTAAALVTMTGDVRVVTTAADRVVTTGVAPVVEARSGATTDPVCRRVRRSPRGSRARSFPRRSARSCVPSRRRPRTAWHGTWSPPAS